MAWELGQRGSVPVLGCACDGPVIFCFGEECHTSTSAQEHFILETDLAKNEAELLRKINLLYVVASKVLKARSPVAVNPQSCTGSSARSTCCSSSPTVSHLDN